MIKLYIFIYRKFVQYFHDCQKEKQFRIFCTKIEVRKISGKWGSCDPQMLKRKKLTPQNLDFMVNLMIRRQ